MGVSKHREPAESWGLHTAAAAAKLSYCRSYHVFAQSHHGVYSRCSRNKYQTLCMWNKQQWKLFSSWLLDLLARKPVTLYCTLLTICCDGSWASWCPMSTSADFSILFASTMVASWSISFRAKAVHVPYISIHHKAITRPSQMCMSQWMNVLNIAHCSATIPVCHLSATCLPGQSCFSASASLSAFMLLAGMANKTRLT